MKQIGGLFGEKKLRDEKLYDKNLEIIQGFDEEKEAFKGFYTYFTGFNQNRENYYQTDGKVTAVSYRIVDENLPKFCDNILVFQSKKEEYLQIWDVLEPTGKIVGNVIKDRNGVSKVLVKIEANCFDISYFCNVLSQRQIDDYNEMIGNANFLVNLYNQHKGGEQGFVKLKGFKTLYKQIGCGKKENFVKSLNNNNEVLDVLDKANEAGLKYFSVDTTDEITLNKFIEYIKNAENFERIYISDVALNTISSKYFGNWWYLADKLKFVKKEKVKLPKVVSLGEFFTVLDREDIIWKDSIKEDKKNIIENSNLKNSQKLLEMLFADPLENAKKFLECADEILKMDVEKYQIDQNREKIREWLELPININRVLKYFAVREKDLMKVGGQSDEKIAEYLKVLLNLERSYDLPDYFGWFDLVRNFLTKKVSDDVKENKLKLNFENAKLASGWDLNKEVANFCTIFKDESDKKYLAIVAKKTDENGKLIYDNKVFEKDLKVGKNIISNPVFEVNGDDLFYKMEYKLLPGPNKMLPKVLFSKEWISENPTPENIKRIYKTGSFKKGDSFVLADLHELIDFYKSELRKYPSLNESYQTMFGFIFSDTSKFESIDQFYSEVELQGYKIGFVPVDKDKILKLVDDGKIYLFEIKNQDSNLGKKDNHKQNLHTIYWNAVFNNAFNKPKLNGKAELFYRPAVKEDKMVKKVDKNGKEILENYRFFKEKFLFHCPLTLNFCIKSKNFNNRVNKELANKDVSVLGIDRGEKHLAYYYLIDKNGKKIKSGSFNEINGKDYNKLLEERAGERNEARKNWKTIGNIKNLKDGYISLVIREIVDLAVANNAVIVMEDLNTGFKRGRQKIEKQVYQKLELALAKKLNFLVDKTAKQGEIGSVEKALQLTPPVTNYGDIENKKQLGVMFYTRANYTSQTDPVTGWRKKIYIQAGSEENIKTQICDNFTEIGFDGGDYYFVYQDKDTKKSWKLWSGKDGKSLDRYRNIPVYENSEKIWETRKQDVVEILDGVFEGWDKSGNLLDKILDGEFELKKCSSEHTAWGSLKYAIDLIQQIRNTGIEIGDEDFIVSPVRDESGKHFDSRIGGGVVSSGDENGAYNIARKGLIMLERIKQNPDKPDLYVKDTDWDEWLMGR